MLCTRRNQDVSAVIIKFTYNGGDTTAGCTIINKTAGHLGQSAAPPNNPVGSMQASPEVGALSSSAQSTLRDNMHVVTQTRALMTIAIGFIAGVMGLRSIAGFIFYVAAYSIVSVVLVARMKGSASTYFPGQSSAAFILDGIGGNLLTYLLFWTIFYAIAHVY